jgi:hypothetical protein
MQCFAFEADLRVRGENFRWWCPLPTTHMSVSDGRKCAHPIVCAATVREEQIICTHQEVLCNFWLGLLASRGGEIALNTLKTKFSWACVGKGPWAGPPSAH